MSNFLSLAPKDEYPENVIHGASIGAGDDEPILVARVQTMPPHVAAGSASSDGESEKKQSEIKEREEIERFKELWLSLVEREQRLELQLMDLDDLREQEATVRELENRLGVAAVEARHLELKVLSLREENERLKEHTSELDVVRAQLGRAKEKVRSLKERVQVEREEAQREAAALRERVKELEKNDEEREKALAAEAASLREANAVLQEENRELARRLQDAEQVATSASLVHEVIVFLVLHSNALSPPFCLHFSTVTCHFCCSELCIQQQQKQLHIFLIICNCCTPLPTVGTKMCN
jgi:myosin heavy subunit